MTYKISVTKAHIDRGTRNNCFGCPVALAMHEHPGLSNSIVERTFVWIDGIGCTKVPAAVLNFVDSFDAGDLVHPFTFDLTVSDDVMAKVASGGSDGH